MASSSELKRGTPGRNGWEYGIDGDANHPDWEHTIDGDYVPKGMKYTLDYDPIIPANRSTSHLDFE